MLYLKSLANVTPNEMQAVGQRATDIAMLAHDRMAIPHGFVVLSNAYDEFVRTSGLKYKVDYILSHAQENVHSSLVNAYNGVRKAVLEAQFQNGFETELRELYDGITAPVGVGDLVATNDRMPVRIIMSSNFVGDSENNDTVIQNISTFDELLVGIREAWALAYHPGQFGERLREKFPETRLKLALIVQTMDAPIATCHAYSCLPQDHNKIYLQIYPGYPDLREKLAKDYYAVAKDGLRIVASQLNKQHQRLGINDAKELVVMQAGNFELIERDVVELSRLAKKAEMLLQVPVKCFFTILEDTIELLWVNRLGFTIMMKPDGVQPAVGPASVEPNITSAQDFIDVIEKPALREEIIEESLLVTVEESTPAPQPVASATQVEMQGVAAKLLKASMRLVRQIAERKYRSSFGETPATDTLADIINRLNEANVFSRQVDAGLLLKAEQASHNDGRISEEEYAKTIEEVAFLMSYA